MTAVDNRPVSAHRIDEADPAWAGLVADGDFFQRPTWQQVIRRTSGAGLQRWVARRGDDVVAGLATVPATTDSPWLLSRPDAVLAGALEAGLDGAAAVAAAVGDTALLPALVAGGRQVGRSRAVGPAADDPMVLHQLLDAVEAHARDSGARCVCLPHVDAGGEQYAGDPALAAVLTERGYLGHDAAVYSWLDVPAGGFEEYMQGLSQHRRRHIRVAGRKLDAAGVELRFAPLGSLPLDVLGAQEAALLTKYGNPADPHTSTALLQIIVDEIGGDALVSYAVRDSTILGFGLVLRSGDQWFGHRAGFDYDAQGDLPLYETVLYYAVLDHAAEQGATVLHAGVGSDHAKQSLRCESSLQRNYLLPLGEHR